MWATRSHVWLPVGHSIPGFNSKMNVLVNQLLSCGVNTHTRQLLLATFALLLCINFEIHFIKVSCYLVYSFLGFQRNCLVVRPEIGFHLQ